MKDTNLKTTALYRSFPVLDGMRAVSILWVVFYHLPVAVPAWVNTFKGRGELGVELFSPMHSSDFCIFGISLKLVPLYLIKV